MANAATITIDIVSLREKNLFFLFVGAKNNCASVKQVFVIRLDQSSDDDDPTRFAWEHIT